MDILLLGIYAFLVWLIFIKLKWLPWTTPWKVGVFIFPVVALAGDFCGEECRGAARRGRGMRQARA